MINILITEILILPWVFLPIKGIDCMRLPKAVIFDLFFFAIISLGIIKGMTFSYKNKYLGLLAAWIFVTIGFNWYYPLLMGIGFNSTTIESSIHFLLSLVASIFVMSTLQKDDYIILARMICYSSMAVSIFSLFQACGFDPLKDIATYKVVEHNHLCALIDHPDTLANFLALTFPFFLFFKENKFKIGMALVLIVIFLTHSTLSMGATVLSTIVFLFLKYRKPIQTKMILILFVLFGVFCLVTPSFNKFNHNFTGRLEVWKMSIPFIKNNPIFGSGLGVFKAFGIKTGFNTMNEGGNLWMFAHNDYIEMVCSIGFLGLFLFILVVIHSLRNFNYKPDNFIGFSYISSFICFLLLMIGSFPMEIAPISLLGLISWWGTEKV